MSNDTYLVLTTYNKGTLIGEGHSTAKLKDLGTNNDISPNTLIPLDAYSLGLDQVLNIGSASHGAGAGKVGFNPFSITKPVDVISPVLFQMCSAGMAFAKLDLLFVKTNGAGNGSQGSVFLQYTFKLAAVGTISYFTPGGGASPYETVTFEFGDLQIRYSQQKADGTLNTPVVGGWNRIQNVADLGTSPVS